MEIFDGFLKKYVNRYTLQLFKKNINYIVITGFLLLLNIYIFTFQVTSYYFQKQAIVTKEAVLTKVTEQKMIISKYTKKEIIKLCTAISLLVPDKEDYFSIISAVENLSSLTGIDIISYSVAFSSSTSEKIVLKVEAKGNIDSLKKFLADYRFKGGRLITMDKIEFSNKDFRSTLDLNFYTRKASLKENEDVKGIDPATLSLFDQVSDTIVKSDVPTDSQSSDLDADYVSKVNPFGM